MPDMQKTTFGNLCISLKHKLQKHEPVDFVTFRVDFVYTKEDGEWKIEYVLWYEGNKTPRLAQRKSKKI